MMRSVPDYGSHDEVVAEDEQRQLSSFRKALLAIALVAGVVVGVTMIGFPTSAPAAAPSATADVAAMSVEEAKTAAMRDFGEVTADTIETEATMAKYGVSVEPAPVRLAEAVESVSCNCIEKGCCDTCTKGLDYCLRLEPRGACGWSRGTKCSGCAGVCGNPALVVTEPPVMDWEDSFLCPDLPEVIDKDPNEVVTLDEDWKLQLPCLDIATDSNGLSYCTDDRTSLINGAASPGVWTVYMSEANSPGSYNGPYLDDFRLMPTEYGDEGEFCSGGMYVAEDDAGDEMIVLHVPIAGTTTPGSKNPRVELRQMLANSNTPGGFDLDEPVDESNKLTTTQSVVHVPANYKSTSVVQVFNGGYNNEGGGPFIEIITQKCQYSWQKMPDGNGGLTRCPPGSIGIGVWKDGKFGGKGGWIFEEYELGTKFDLEVEAPGDGSVTMRYKHSGDEDWLSTYTFDCDDLPTGVNPCLAGQSGDAAYPTANGVYFKVGSYIQKAPDEAATDYALSYLYSAEVTGPATGAPCSWVQGEACK